MKEEEIPPCFVIEGLASDKWLIVAYCLEKTEDNITYAVGKKEAKILFENYINDKDHPHRKDFKYRLSWIGS